MNPDIENRLRSLTWRPVPGEALERSLQAALEALPPPHSPPCRRRRFFPRPLRWALAACWALSLGLRLATPGTPPSPAGDADAAAMIESLQLTNDRIHALERELQFARR